MFRRASTWTVVATLLCLLLAAGAAPAQDPQTLVNEAYNLYQRGREDEALSKLKAVLAQDPSSEQAYELLETLEQRAWVRIMIRKGEHESVVKELFRRARDAERSYTADPEAIKELVTKLDSEDWSERRNAFLSLVRNHGEYTVPYLVPRLDSDDTLRRAAAMEWLRRLGVQAVQPLIQTLESESELRVANAARILGQIGHRAALPYLLDLAAGEGRTARGARDGLASMDAGTDAGMREAAFLELAEAYYRGDTSVVNPFRGLYAVWAFEDGKLVSREVPRGVYHLKLAESVLYDHLARNPESQDGRVLLASVLIAQAQVSEPAESAEGGSPEAVLAKARVLATVEGLQVLDATVRKAIADGRPAVAAGAVDLLGDMIDRHSWSAPNGLTDALAAPYKEVRYLSALALARLAPRGGFENSGLVVRNLMDALGQAAARSVLVIDDNPETREEVLSQLQERGFFAAGAPTGAFGLSRLRESPIEDAVIIRYDLKDRTVAQIIKELRQDEGTAHVVIALLAPSGKVEEARSNYEGKVQLVIEAPGDASTYGPELRKGMKDLEGAREQATLLAARAARALADMEPGEGGAFSPASAVDALVGTLKRDDRVRIPAMEALGRIGDPKCLPALLETFQDAASSEEVRGHAAVALARVSRAQGSTSQAHKAALKEAIRGEGGDAYMRMLGKAVGIAPMGDAERVELLQALRDRIRIDLMEEESGG